MTSATPVRVESRRDVVLDWSVRLASGAFLAAAAAVVADVVRGEVGGLDVGGGVSTAASSAASGDVNLLPVVALLAIPVVAHVRPDVLEAVGRAVEAVLDVVVDVVTLPVRVAFAPVVVVHEWTHVLAARAFGVRSRVEFVDSRVGPWSVPVPAGGECVPEPFSSTLRRPLYQHRLISLAPLLMWSTAVAVVWLLGVRDGAVLARSAVVLLALFGPSGSDWSNATASRGAYEAINYDVGPHLEAEGLA